MNFIKETDRFARDLENWKKGHGYTNLEGLKDLMDIWHTFINLPERKAVTYPNVTAHIPLVDYKCGKCGPLTDALTLIYAWRKSKELQNEVYVDFTGVEKAEVEEVKMSFDIPQTFPKADDIIIEAVGGGDDIPNGELIYVQADPNGDIEVLDPIEGFIKVSKVDYTKLKMHELRSIAKKKPNLEFSNKTTKEELIRLINS